MLGDERVGHLLPIDGVASLGKQMNLMAVLRQQPNRRLKIAEKAKAAGGEKDSHSPETVIAALLVKKSELVAELDFEGRLRHGGEAPREVADLHGPMRFVAAPAGDPCPVAGFEPPLPSIQRRPAWSDRRFHHSRRAPIRRGPSPRP